jgi:hypothetical protein
MTRGLRWVQPRHGCPVLDKRTDAPVQAKSTATAAPIPWLAPVTVDLPVKSSPVMAGRLVLHPNLLVADARARRANRRGRGVIMQTRAGSRGGYLDHARRSPKDRDPVRQSTASSTSCVTKMPLLGAP